MHFCDSFKNTPNLQIYKYGPCHHFGIEGISATLYAVVIWIFSVINDHFML